MSIPYSKLWYVLWRGSIEGRAREVELFGSIDEDVVDFDEDGATELDGCVRVAPGMYCCRATADVGGALEYGDVGRESGIVRVLGEVVCR